MIPRRLELDYVAPAGRSPWPGAALLAAALALGGHLVLDYRAVSGELAATAAAPGPREARSPRAGSGRLEEMKQVELVVRQLALPWAQIVQSVEAASMPEVGVLNMQPDPQQRLLRLSAEAKTREAMLEYVRRMAQTPAFSEVHLVNHQVQNDDAAHPIQFAVHASFREGT
jgi:hypothetical protein